MRKIIPIPNKKYRIVYADPPWPYKSRHGGNCAPLPYPTMELEDICSLNVKDIVRDDAVLFLWTTDSYLKRALKVMKAWGFKYKTIGFVWIKRTIKGKFQVNVSYWTMKSTELCLLGVRGKPHRLLERRNIRQLVQSVNVRRKHSRKPDEVRKRIDLMFGDLPRIELFARKKTSGWDVWGEEV